MALIGAILVEIKIIEILCERSSGEGDRQALSYSRRRGEIAISRLILDKLSIVQL